jgi:K+-sensing histidine kinase KdpD
MKKFDVDQTIFLIQNITHQAVNPLSGVIGTLDNLINNSVPEHKREQRLKRARGQLEYTVSLIRNLSFFAEYAADTSNETVMSSDKTSVLPQIIIESAQFFQELGESHDIKIELYDKNVQNCIKGDPELLKQVFMNIFDNAIKYGEEGTVVVVKNWIQKKTGILIVTVEGKSVPFENGNEIFQIGYRDKRAKGKTSSGSGLGLHICKLIVEKIFKGTISARYTSSGKAIFEIRLPNGFVKGRQ